MESKESETIAPSEVLDYARELKEVLGESSFMQRKTFLRSFVKRIEVNPNKVAVDYVLPLPPEKDGTSTREVLNTNRNGSAYGICHWLR
jgi:hypothetical protein